MDSYLLEAYYATEGRNNNIRIVLPSGSYQPVFSRMTPSTPPAVQYFEPKSIQSQGPKVYISCQDTAFIRDDALRGLVYNMRSMLPMLLGNFREVRIALASIHQPQSAKVDAFEVAWRHHQAEFLLQCAAEVSEGGFAIQFVLFHTLTREVVWSDSTHLPQHYVQPTLEAVFSQLTQALFSLHQGVAMAYWSRYWKTRDTMPSHYQVLVEHIAFIQDKAGDANLQAFLDACKTRTQRYHDDALAHLHYAVLCLYAYMLRDAATPVETQWHRLALRALELNPGNALAHSIFALECFYRGDHEMGLVEIATARQVNPYDVTGGHLMAVGLCALRQWELAFTLRCDLAALESPYPDPLRTVPCLFYFRRGEFARLAALERSYAELGGWETFGKLTQHCRTDDCKGCIQALSGALDKVVDNHEMAPLLANPLGDSIQPCLAKPASPLINDNSVISG